MARINRPCPICEEKPPMVRQEVESIFSHLQSVRGDKRMDFTKSICKRCWTAIIDNLVDGAK